MLSWSSLRCKRRHSMKGAEFDGEMLAVIILCGTPSYVVMQAAKSLCILITKIAATVMSRCFQLMSSNFVVKHAKR